MDRTSEETAGSEETPNARREPRLIDVAQIINDRKIGMFHVRLVTVSCLITVFDGFDMMLIGFTAPYMRDELAISTMQMGNIFSAGMFGAMIGAFLISNLGDRIGRRPTVVLCAYVFGALTFLTGFARSYETLMLMRFIDGVAIGGMLPLAWALNIEYVPDRFRSTVVTLVMIGYSIGSTVSGPVTVWLAPHFGWEAVFFFGGTATLICAALLHFELPESLRFLVSKNRPRSQIAGALKRIAPEISAGPNDRYIVGDETEAPKNFTVASLFEGWLRWLTPLLWLGYFISSLAIIFQSSWGPILLEDLSFDRNTAALASSLSSILGAGAGLSLMRFTDRIGPKAVAFYPVITIPVLLAIGFAPMPQIALLWMIILASTLIAGAHFGILSIIGVYYPTTIRANGSGWATTVAKTGSVIGPIIGAAILSSGMPLIHTFSLLAVCPAVLALCATGIAAIVKRNKKEQQQKPPAIGLAQQS
ncbi:MFS transporter [Hyphococcus luteus]|uniref:MFS transporter n=1 Tax=Hyphococcus luteus TaxID=2058213 RepID=A0A2S7KAJ6_9PROT|nr:MFS transporter [Marinicaulis flavus]PQA89498.1 MFS transporter [Marinicaulis flavus]